MICEGYGPGGPLPQRIFGSLGKQAQVVTQGYGRYADPVLRGNCYWGSNLLGTPVTTQAGLSATTPALTLYNPQGSNVVLVLYRVCVDITSSPAAASGLCIAANDPTAAAPTAVTNATIYNALEPGAAVVGKGRCYRIATLAAAPVSVRPIGGVTGASAISGYGIDVDLGGEICIKEGGCLSLQATTAAAIVGAFFWEEVSQALAA